MEMRDLPPELNEGSRFTPYLNSEAKSGGGGGNRTPI